MKKKIWLCVVIILAIINVSIPVFADDNWYYVPELEMSIAFPDSFFVVTEETLDNVISEYSGENISEEQRNTLKAEILPIGTYLDAWRDNFDPEIVISMRPDYQTTSFSQIQDSRLLELVDESLKTVLEEKGVIISSAGEVYHHSQTKFYKLATEYSYEGAAIYGLTYVTVHNQKAITITVRSDSEITDTELENTFDAIIDSVKFDKTDSSAPAVSPSADTRTTSTQLVWIGLLLGLLFTFIVHLLPILIYRYAIKKEPISPSKARRIVIIDTIIVFLINVGINILVIVKTNSYGSSVSAVAFILWAIVSYKILTKGYLETHDRNEASGLGVCPIGKEYKEEGESFIDDPSSTFNHQAEDSKEDVCSQFEKYDIKNNQSEDDGEITDFIDESANIILQEEQKRINQVSSLNNDNKSTIIANQPSKLFCRKCGAQLLPDSAFCNHCGTKVIRK